MEQEYSQSKNGSFDPREENQSGGDPQSNSPRPLPSQSDYEFQEEHGKQNYSPQSFNHENQNQDSHIEEFSGDDEYEDPGSGEVDGSKEFPQIDGDHDQE